MVVKNENKLHLKLLTETDLLSHSIHDPCPFMVSRVDRNPCAAVPYLINETQKTYVDLCEHVAHHD